MAAPPLLPTNHVNAASGTPELITAETINDIAFALNSIQIDFGLRGAIANDASAAAAATNVAVWNEAMALLPASGGTLVLNGGLYYMNTRVAITRSRVRVLGGPGCGIKLAAGANSCGLVIGNLAGSPAVTDVLIDGMELDGSFATQTARGGSSWEAVFSNCGIVAYNAYRVGVRNCYVHDWWATGIEISRTGQAIVSHNFVDNTGLTATPSPRNGISCLGVAADSSRPSVGIVIDGNEVRRITDIGIDAHGAGSRVVSITGNTVQGLSTTGSAGWGISAEIESADLVDNIGNAITGNNIDGVTVAIAIVNTQNTTRQFAATPVVGNVISNCLVGMYVEGQHLAIHGNTIWNVRTGISTNNATAIVACGDWTITGNTIRLDPSYGSVFGCWGIGLRWQASAVQRVLDGVIIEDNTMSGVGSVNQREDHSGIYLITLYNATGPLSAAINRVTIGKNHIHGFEHGVTLNSPNVASPIVNTMVRDVRAWGNRSYGLNFAGSGTISGTTVAGAELVGNGAGGVNGMTAAFVDSIRGTTGVNPAGRLTLPRGSIPAVPVASTTYTNDTNYDCTVYITGGTGVTVSIGGVSTGLGVGAFTVAARQTISLGAFSVAPSWVWFGE